MEQSTVDRRPGDQVDSVLVAPGGKRLHVPNEGRPLCAGSGDHREKPLAVFPVAHRDWCRACLKLWRRHHGTDGPPASRGHATAGRRDDGPLRPD